MRIVIAGMGVAGGVIAAGLADLPGVELACVEQVDRDEPCGGRPALQVEACDRRRMLGAADLLVVAEGRYLSPRTQLCGPPTIRHLGVANFRVLLDDGGALPIDDLEQWYSGPNRLLAFRVRDGLIYLSGNLPLAPG